jgi:phage gp29-like protein
MRWPWQRQPAAPTVLTLRAGELVEQEQAPTKPTSIDVEISGARKLFRQYPAVGLTPRKLQHILHDADQGYSWRLMELLDDVANDPKVGSSLRNRKLRVAGAPWRLEPPPGDTSDLGKKIAEDATGFTRRLPKFQQLKMDLLDAPYRGFAASVPDWALVGGRFDVIGHKPIETRFFRFDDGAERPLVETDRVPTGEPLPEGVLFHVSRDKAGSLVRGGFGRAIVKFWLYKHLNLIDGMSFLERFGHPHVQVEIPSNIKPGSEEFERAKAAALSFIVDQVGLVPPGVTIKFVDAINKAGTLKDMYIAFWDWCDTAFALAIEGQTLTSAAGPGGLGHGAEAEQHGDTQQAITESDALQLGEMLTEQLYRPWTNFHYGPNAPAPILIIDVSEEEDEQAKATTLKTRADTLVVLNRGLRLPLSKNQVRTIFDAQEPDPQNPDDAIQPSASPLPLPGTVPGEDGEPVDPKLSARDGACPHCNGFFTLAEAEKKKRSVLWGLSRT